MDFKEIEQKNLNFYAPRFEVEIEGTNLLRKEVPITSVSVVEKLNNSARFSIQIDDEYDINTQEFKWLDNPLFHAGKDVIIKMGYGSNLHMMIVGKIETISSSLFSNATPTLKVEGYDLAYHFLKNASKEYQFNNKTDSEIAQEIVATFGSKVKLTASVDPTTEKHDKLTKTNRESFFNFLKKRALKINYELYVSVGTLYFIEKKEDPDELFTLEWGKNLNSFNPVVSTAGQLTKVENRSMDIKTKKVIVGTAKAGDENTQEKGKKKGSQVKKETGIEAKKVTHFRVDSNKESNNMTKGGLNKSTDKFITGSGSTIGIPELRCGVLIRLDKLGKRFSGKYRVKEVTHTIDTSGYKVNFTVKRNAE
ncbi:MAG: hypothetical protein C5S41_13350 [Candidatus Methanomarinus sp.]|nr:MAG: hypothetical protein C5S41_13350 [ANME-2 cluster archaeon]